MTIERKRIVKAIAQGAITIMDAGEVIEENKNQEALLKQEIEMIGPQLEGVPSEREIKNEAALLKRIIRSVYRNYPRLPGFH